MKKTILFLLVAAVFAACNPDEPEVFQLDPLAMVSIKPEQKVWIAEMRVKADGYLSALEIVKQTTVIQYKYDRLTWERGFEGFQRDTISETPALKMWGTDIISNDGELVPDFIESKDVILVHWHENNYWLSLKDTIGYIPNSVLREAELAIKEAYAAKDAELVYQIFNDAFTFRPTTGTEYRELQLLNQN